MEAIKVKFYIEEDKSVLAYFPFDNYNKDGYTKTCYSHVGQHSACVPDYVSELKEATADEMLPLYTELINIGYLPELV
jgi:hypothetical protein